MAEKVGTVTGRKDSWSFPPPGRLPDPIGGETQCFQILHSSALKQYGILPKVRRAQSEDYSGNMLAGMHLFVQLKHPMRDVSFLCQAMA